MAKTETNLIMLGIVAVIAIMVLIFLFKFVMTAATVNKEPYYSPSLTYANKQANPFPYEAGAMSMPSQTYGAEKGECAVLATPQIAKVAEKYQLDANYQQMLAFQSRGAECIHVEDSESGYCCTIPPQ